MELFDGKKIAQKILEDIGGQIKKEKIQPTLAVILVGENEVSSLYIKLKKEAASKIGIKVEEYFFDAKATSEQIILKIQELNKESKINGIIVQLPLPAIFDTDKIIEAIDPKKDVDGFHKENRRLFELGKESLAPVLPSAILLAVKSAGFDLEDKKILALVNSDIFGQTLKTVFKKDGLKLNYIVRKTCIVLGIEKEIKSADVLIMVCGCPKFIKSEMIKEGAALIDGGITRFHDGRVVGDIDSENVKTKAVYLTPVPGGLGPLTIALLLKNVYLAAKKT